MASGKKRRRVRRGASRSAARRGFPWRRAILGVFWLSLLGAMGWSVAYLTDSKILPIRRVGIRGQLEHVPKQRLREAVVTHVSGGFFSVDLAAVQAAVKKLPWVDSASVRRVWPDSLRIRIQEHVALARWGEAALVSIDGEIFAPPEERFPPGLPALAGPVGSMQLVISRFKRIQARLKPLGLRVARLTMGKRRNWHIRFENGMALALGRVHSVERLHRFQQAYAQLLRFHREDIKRVDMRYTNGFAVAWRGGQPPAWLLREEG